MTFMVVGIRMPPSLMMLLFFPVSTGSAARISASGMSLAAVVLVLLV